MAGCGHVEVLTGELGLPVAQRNALDALGVGAEHSELDLDRVTGNI